MCKLARSVVGLAQITLQAEVASPVFRFSHVTFHNFLLNLKKKNNIIWQRRYELSDIAISTIQLLSFTIQMMLKRFVIESEDED